ncbi:hypothetical protein [Chryseolinea sp. H1M3-3]|uniref:hypothetical protein n=1 Tax=Chryseolinea sp. H1M3-3 TaxID=3034144 RepID=UPI0023EB9AF7|nr:hypothetical protein [Chryseolinea sp. H1M3-3]
MAIAKFNPILKSVSGKVGLRLMFKQRGKTTVLSSVPRKPGKRTEAQKACAAKFKGAAVFAKAVLRNQTIKAYYKEICRQRDQHSAYVSLLKDILNSPIALTEELLLERASKAPRVENKPKNKKHDLEVIVRTAQGDIIAQGCVSQSDGNQWIYKAPHSGIEVVITKA